ncbi:MAG: serine/threonine protein kinase [Acidobacteria bacterium]|nr:serine/threonine protein kinase [Acidobacteriota bacterium]
MKSPETMRQLEELFHEAAGLEAQQRAEFIVRARISHPELASAVESLIAAHEQADSLIDAPAFEAAAEMIFESQPALVAGQLVGHYQVIKALGKGGMGEVYLANDTNLDRKVALKLLPAEYTNHKERLRRFILEAKAASSLNHPNIITIHEIGEIDGAHFIATEFIDGQTLKEHMAGTPLSLQEILEVSIQAAGALQAAHTAGIVHRDVKPDNIMLRPDGYVKVLDFGLAKLTEKSHLPTPADSELDTMVKAKTVPGTVLGTVNYMSPEQARGQVLDQRTDVFSFGVVLYEMAAGRRPFAAATSVDTLVAILEKEPAPLDGYTPDMPPEFERILSKALCKDREQRYQTIKDLLIDLKHLKEELVFAQKLERSRPPRSRVSPPNTTPANGSATMIQPPARRTEGPNIIPEPVRERPKSFPSAATLALVLVLLTGLIGGVALWRVGRSDPRSGSGFSTVKPVPAAQRTLSYWITVQKYRDGKPYQDPFPLRDDINFEKDYQLRLNISSPQSGRLYLLNEGPAGADPIPTFNVMFPTTTTNKGSALLTQNQQVQIPEQSWFDFDGQQGTEKIWLIWAEQDVPELEAVKGFANKKDLGIISSPGLRTVVNQFLKAHSAPSAVVDRNEDKKETVVTANGTILVHIIKLEHH